MRGKQAPKREIQVDDIYGSVLVAKFINYIMLDGKKSIATNIVYKALENLGTKTKTSEKKDILANFEKAIENIKPRIEVKSKRVGGSNFQVPTPVNADRQISLAFRWIIAAARKQRGAKEFFLSLSNNLFESYKGEGEAVKKKEDVHRMADANKAFSQFA